jgi:phospholipase/carboxylesterase
MQENPLVIQQPQTPAQQLILLLHAAGATPASMAPMGHRLCATFPNAAIVCLQGPVPLGEVEGYEWFIQLGEQDKDIAFGVADGMPDLLDDIRGWQARVGLDHKATALIGFAQGAIMALEAGNIQPPVASRIIAIAGRYSTLPPVAPAVTTIHFLHGKTDDTIHYRHTVEAAHHLRDLGTDITAEVIPFVGHDLNAELMDKVVEKLATHIPQQVWEEAQRQAAAEGGGTT